MTPRERFFDCTLVSEEDEYRFTVRAWTANEAEDHLRHSLRESGVRKPGTLFVRDSRSATLRVSPYLIEP